MSTTSVIMPRLRLCALDITGVNAALEYEMSGSPQPGLLPFIEWGIGPEVTPTRRIGRGSWEIAQVFIGTAYLAETTGTHTNTKGDQGIVAAAPFVDRIRRYFMEHAMLDTTSLDELDILNLPVEYQQITRLGVLSESNYIGFQFQLTIKWKDIP